MAAPINLSAFTFEGELLQTVGELSMDAFVQAIDVTAIHTIYPNIVGDKEIGFIGSGGLTGKANQGCDPTAHTFSIASRMLKWEPADIETLIHACWSDLKGTAAQYSLKTGTQIPDFTQSDYMNIVTEVLQRSMKDATIRLAWFGDVDADVIANGGILTAGTDKTYFNPLDGFFKQMEVQVTVNPDQLVTITENAGVSYAAQALVPANVQGYLQDAVFNAPLTLQAQENKIIPCTQSFYNGYAKSLQGVGIESLYANLVNGQKTLTYNGIPLIPIPKWDEIIAAYENTGVKLNNPHRAVLTTKENLGIGVDNPSALDSLEVWYDKDSRKVKIESMFTMDAKIMNPDLFMLISGSIGS